LCGKIGHTTNMCPKGKESRANRGRKSQEQILRRTQRQVRRPLVQFKEEVNLMKQDCCSSPELSESSNSDPDYSDEHINMHIQQCDCTDTDECLCNLSEKNQTLIQKNKMKKPHRKKRCVWHIP